MSLLTRPVVVTVAGHFGAAFAALCMPPFYAYILQANFSSQSLALAGWYFTLPTLAAAVANPLWGRLGDRIGRRASLIRAHAGLCLSFILTGLARTPLEFALGLTLQGLLGGTFSASNAFLAEQVSASRLSTLLGVMQASARTALFAGPALIGLLSGRANLLHLFFYLAVFPAAASLILCLLPDPPARAAGAPAKAAAGGGADCGVAAATLYQLQAMFTVGTVLSYPYFVIDLGERLGVGAATAGLLFGLPHALFLLLAWPIGRTLGFGNARASLARYAALTCAGLLLQLVADDLAWLVGGRLLMGVGMTGAYLSINTLAAATTVATQAGSHFGKLEGANKWGAVAAGLLASVLVAPLGYAAPMWLGCALLGMLFIFMNWKMR
ncbi:MULTISPECIES: MFS transporter [unclassified Janthinobacterium]|uniref:MFS transporter n=1 Tax=unclassified Janthinobacterium TaxID=2610881 RepID=UPI00036A67A2|nr:MULTISPECIES: MFS transporter [unclassified Janthinobacterium]MEC5159383.1 MFS family permease [Janthinobacterium sp. CG_S6]